MLLLQGANMATPPPRPPRGQPPKPTAQAQQGTPSPQTDLAFLIDNEVLARERRGAWASALGVPEHDRYLRFARVFRERYRCPFPESDEPRENGAQP